VIGTIFVAASPDGDAFTTPRLRIAPLDPIAISLCSAMDAAVTRY